MLIPSFFVVDIDQYDHPYDILLPENAFIAYKADMTSPVSETLYRHLFFTKVRHPFCLLVFTGNLSGQTETDLAKFNDHLAAITFHYNYLKRNYDNPFILFDTDPANGEGLVGMIRHSLKDQGYNDIEAVTLYADDEKRSTGHPADWYASQLRNPSLTSASFCLFFPEDQQNMAEILNDTRKEEEMLLKNSPQVYRLLTENQALLARQDELSFTMGLLQEKIDSFNNYNIFYNQSDSRYKRQITEVLSFYKNEYEILPLWFKRIGHLLKVITGKRTFRSLYDDNVKKYKV